MRCLCELCALAVCLPPCEASASLNESMAEAWQKRYPHLHAISIQPPGRIIKRLHLKSTGRLNQIVGIVFGFGRLPCVTCRSGVRKEETSAPARRQYGQTANRGQDPGKPHTCPTPQCGPAATCFPWQPADLVPTLADQSHTSCTLIAH